MALHVFNAGQRIKQLNDIDRDVAKLLQSAGLAIKALSNVSTAPEAAIRSATLEQHKGTFTTATAQYFSLLSSIDIRLRRQIYALEEAEIISAEAPAKETHSNPNLSTAFAAFGGGQSGTAALQTATEKNITSTAGGLGNLDVGWLNGRNDNVGKDMEAELWAKAQEFVSSLTTKADGQAI
ncbi:Mediator complex, subunit Med11 [Lasallia pustulata]|uniref:Mediator of RNA polymerase II transcription subunit 11 n=1 Tax=Lasallia pustulata TaxID=136370 RepID=A0A1W5CUG1_9LECA|nr:Mediator complex, subunit Med11 [Lasallia pustulata]